MKKKKVVPPANLIPPEVEQRLQEEKKNDDRQEIDETIASKQLDNAMVKSARMQQDDTLQKIVDYLHNQNGTVIFFY